MPLYTTIPGYTLGNLQHIEIKYEDRWNAPKGTNGVALNQDLIKNSAPNMDGYSLKGADKLKLINRHGDSVEFGNDYKIEVKDAPEITKEAIEKYKQLVEVEKKYGVHGIVINNITSEKQWEEEYGSLYQANMDKFVYSAYAKAEGVSELKSNIIFDRREFAEKIYLFFNKIEDTSFKSLGYVREGYYTDEDREAIKKLTGQLNQAFNELADNIAKGKGDSIKALESKITVKGYDVTLGEILEIGDLFEVTGNMVNSGPGNFHFSYFNNNDDRYATVGLGKAYFMAYVNERMEGAGAELAKSAYNEYFSVMLDHHEEWMKTLSVPKGTEKTHPNTVFKGTYKEQMFNIFASIDTGSEKAFKGSIKSALEKAVKFDYDVMMARGGGHNYSYGCAQDTRMFINEVIGRIISFDKVSTIK